MRLLHQIALALVAAAVVPLGTVGFQLIVKNEQALEEAVHGRFEATARLAAAAVADEVEGKARQLTQTASLVDWAGLDEAELHGALLLVRRQTHAAAVEWRPDGAGRTARDADSGVPDDLPWRAAPLERARSEGLHAVVYSPPFRPGAAGSSGSAIAAAQAVRGGVLALYLPLDGAVRRLSEARATLDATLTLLDDRGQPIGSAGAPQPLPRGADDAFVVAASAPVGGLGWTLVVHDRAEHAFAAPRAMRRQTLVVTALAGLIALVLATLLSLRITGALGRLSAAARALGAGDLSVRAASVAARGDELGQLARTFDAMGGELQKSRAEIEGWNRELEARVVERTRELKEAQAQLVQAQKLAALGQLGAGVAHEINNPLAAIVGHVQLLLAEHAAGDADHESLRCIDEGARRATAVVQNLLRFSVQHQQPVRTAVDVNRLVQDTLTLTESLIRDQRIAIELELDTTVPRLRADAGQLQQVLLNLVANSRTAMPSGGVLRVRTTLGEGGGVALSVADTGRGIPSDIRDRLFEPFFTTKDEWSNVGLGLSVSYRIVSEHGGKITVESEPGHGATFTVVLPA